MYGSNAGQGLHHSHRCGGRHGSFCAGWLLFRGRGNLRADVVAAAAENGANRSQDLRAAGRRVRIKQGHLAVTPQPPASVFMPRLIFVKGEGGDEKGTEPLGYGVFVAGNGISA